MSFINWIEEDCNVLQKIISVFIVLVFSTSVFAHEFWLEPINFKVEAGKKIRAHEKVGQDFKGNKYSYLSTSYESLNLTLGNKTRAVKSRLGDLPAISEQVEAEGLAILSAVTTPSEVTYETWNKFSNFLNNKDLQWVFDEHKKRGLPTKNFTESYRRYGKSLIKVGHGKGDDQALGLLFEWVIETNPYTNKTGPIKAQLLWREKPYANALVSVFNRVGKELIKTKLKTNSEGKVEIPRAKGGKFLINAVKMLEASKQLTKEKGVVWDSRWASVTYEIESR